MHGGFHRNKFEPRWRKLCGKYFSRPNPLEKLTLKSFRVLLLCSFVAHLQDVFLKRKPTRNMRNSSRWWVPLKREDIWGLFCNLLCFDGQWYIVQHYLLFYSAAQHWAFIGNITRFMVCAVPARAKVLDMNVATTRFEVRIRLLGTIVHYVRQL